jgi:hypothetical protein
MTVVPSERERLRGSSTIVALVWVSRLPAGSSARMTDGLLARYLPEVPVARVGDHQVARAAGGVPGIPLPGAKNGVRF